MIIEYIELSQSTPPALYTLWFFLYEVLLIDVGITVR